DVAWHQPDLKVRLDAPGRRVGLTVDDLAVGEGVVLGRDAEVGLAATDATNLLHAALAVRTRADQHRAVVVAQAAGDDLAGRRRSLVEQHDDGQVLELTRQARPRPVRRSHLVGAFAGDRLAR